MTSWTVRTSEGSLEFSDFRQLEWAYQNGLISPDDEIQDPGKTEWRKAAVHPHLAVRRRAKATLPRAQLFGILGAIAIALAALVLLALGYWMFSFALGMALAMYMLRFNKRALRPRTFART